MFWEKGFTPSRSKLRQNLPTALTQAEISKLLGYMFGKHLLTAKLLYGCGLRMMEFVRRRVKDVDFGRSRMFLRNTKGGEDRPVMLPVTLREDFKAQIDEVIDLHQKDIQEGFGEIYIPAALSRKYKKAATEPGWQYVFPAKKEPGIPDRAIILPQPATRFSQITPERTELIRYYQTGDNHFFMYIQSATIWMHY